VPGEGSEGADEVKLPLFGCWVLLSLAAYRLQRIVTLDEWPPSEAFRDWVEKRTGAASGWSTLFTCSWCFGAYVSAAAAALAHLFVVDMLSGKVHNRVGVLVMLGLAVSTVVGYAGSKE
jgi:hypothetical protein